MKTTANLYFGINIVHVKSVTNITTAPGPAESKIYTVDVAPLMRAHAENSTQNIQPRLKYKNITALHK